VVHAVSRRAPGSDAGAVAVAIFAIVMFTLAALVADLGVALETRRQAQNTADAAALAGAGEMYDSSNTLQPAASIAAIKKYAASNFGTTATQWTSCSTTVPAGWVTTVGGQPTRTTCIAYDSATSSKKVQVVVPAKHTGTFFDGVVGYRGSDINALAQASLQPDSTFSCVVCVLADYSGQNGSLLVTNGGSP
jgi:Flp pilus assembly protein TadG